ncbi:GNAT family N-acetyltransferase [Draconibacterium sediminis]|uniref:GNAT family N-acetyltransferase n=1 Tax=Draconibacterium sediminis TaxID=1544798 RepID=UPI0026EDF4BF|nr:GNAT family protein [Draconibacterium sediminis]
MTEREIRKYIDRLNNGKAGESIFTRQISKTVEVAKVWTEQPKMTDSIIGNFGSYRFFFIKNESNKYVGAVLDMYQDLHWYIVPKSRKQGYLTNALKESILPYLFYDEREVQRITIEQGAIGEVNYLNSKNVALKLGFKPINGYESEFELKQTDFNWDYENLKETNSDINSDRFKQLRKRAFYAYKTLYKISDELLMSLNDDKDLKEVADEVRKYTWKIEDLEWERNKTIS